MSKPEAKNLLDIVRRGADVCQSLINQALQVSGDMPSATTENAGAGAFAAISRTLEVA